MNKIVAVILLSCLTIGCNKFKGEKGDKGDSGSIIPSAVVYEYSAQIPAGDSSRTILSEIPSDTNVSVYIEVPKYSNVWVELGMPTGTNGTLYPYCALDFNSGTVYYYNIPQATRTKVIGITNK